MESASVDWTRPARSINSDVATWMAAGPLLSSTTPVLFGCHDKCACPPACYRKLVLKNPETLDVFETEGSGGSLRTLVDIKRGEAVINYEGEIYRSMDEVPIEHFTGKFYYVMQLYEHVYVYRALFAPDTKGSQR